MADYELMHEEPNADRYSWWRMPALILVTLATTTLVYMAWSSAYDERVVYPPRTSNVPAWWYRRAVLYTERSYDLSAVFHDFRLTKMGRVKARKLIEAKMNATSNESTTTNALVISSLSPNAASSNVVAAATTAPPSTPQDEPMRLVCYYTSPEPNQPVAYNLRLSLVSPNLCSHINIGMADVYHNSTLALSAELKRVLRDEAPLLRAKNPALKLLLWVGGGDTGHEFTTMVKQHSTRKVFIQSLKQTLREYALDGVDLDWEFPSAYNKERQHFSQLLYEIRQEYIRERRSYLLSLAVAAPEGIALFAYDVPEINKYADYVNLMTYDYHFYARDTPFTGLNAPLFARPEERSIMATLNVNYTVFWWVFNGLDQEKINLGVATYGHTFTLINPFNDALGAPAEGFGRCGSKGFTTYSEICWFQAHNLIKYHYEQQICSPYLSSGTEWISYENEYSIGCKASFAKALELGGVMVFSLNTDDVKNYCNPKSPKNIKPSFPLIEKVKSVISMKQTKQRH